jgi:hypothetical protein
VQVRDEEAGVNDAGPGLKLHFLFLGAMAAAAALGSLLTLPLMMSALAGSGIPPHAMDSLGFASLTLGNIGRAAFVALPADPSPVLEPDVSPEMQEWTRASAAQAAADGAYQEAKGDHDAYSAWQAAFSLNEYSPNAYSEQWARYAHSAAYLNGSRLWETLSGGEAAALQADYRRSFNSSLAARDSALLSLRQAAAVTPAPGSAPTQKERARQDRRVAAARAVAEAAYKLAGGAEGSECEGDQADVCTGLLIRAGGAFGSGNSSTAGVQLAFSLLDFVVALLFLAAARWLAKKADAVSDKTFQRPIKVSRLRLHRLQLTALTGSLTALCRLCRSPTTPSSCAACPATSG